ncbi:uncharacterized protein B0H18DRAFT_873619, partial [Fomitopsis serialis]|uniref:uncharacterized protein n=1 Tax=Fomitopsis serialis TaxID=139415 RepID=UPI0020079744
MESGLGEEASNESASLSGLSAVDQLGEDFERSLSLDAALSETDKATLRTFALKTDEHLTRRTLEKLPFAFPGAHVPSANHLRTRVAFLSGIKPVLYDCCPNSCCCYTGPHAALDNCPYCKAPRRDSRGKARSQFSYIPLIPRLQAFQANTEMATAMKHRAHGHTHKADTISDVYDSTAYRSKLRQRVRVHDKELRHCHFSDPRDVALGLATDGFGPFRRRNKT